MSSPELQELERNIATARTHIELGAALERMQRTSDFKAVFQRGYFEDELRRLVLEKTDKAFADPANQHRITSRIEAIGYLMRFFEELQTQADLARKRLEADEQTREDILAEET